MTTQSPTDSEITVIEPGDAGYDELRRGWNLAADQHPAAIVTAGTVEDVQAALAYAAEHDLTVATQGTGHRAPAVPSLERSLLLRTDLHDEVEVDVDTRRARVKAGALWEHVVEAAAPHGLTALHGSSPTVGVVGYLLGGGLSFYARRYGLAANHVTAIDVVTADGEARRVDSGTEPDLFWALRGGGGSFGVVTAVEIELLAIETVHAGALFWPVGDAPAVLRAWRDWCAAAPPEVTTAFRVLAFPDIPDVPEPLRGRTLTVVDGAFLGDVAAGEELLAPLRAAAEPMIDTWAQIPAAGMLRVHMDPEQPVPAVSGTCIVGDLDDAALDAFLAVTGEGSGSPLLMAELRQLGGALAEPPAGTGACGAVAGSFLVYGVGIPATPELAEAIPARLDTLVETLRPWSTGRRAPNFTDSDGPASDVYDAAALPRLVEARRRWDPHGRFVTSHRIG
jgi:hypothetical protein